MTWRAVCGGTPIAWCAVRDTQMRTIIKLEGVPRTIQLEGGARIIKLQGGARNEIKLEIKQTTSSNMALFGGGCCLISAT